MTKPVAVGRALLFLNVALWVAFASWSLARTAQPGAQRPTMLLVMGVLMLGNAGALGLAGLALRPGRRAAFWLAVALVAANAILSVTDEFGPFDLVPLALSLVTLWWLVARRRAIR